MLISISWDKGKSENLLIRNPFFPAFNFLWGSMEGDPLSPPEGEAAQGEYPLDPLAEFLYLDYCNRVMFRHGQKYEVLFQFR
ncbi:MAG: hypothetical protein WC593_12920 [Methanoregula sp.]